MTDAYCVKCKSKRQMQDGQRVHHEERTPCHEQKVPRMRDGALPDS